MSNRLRRATVAALGALCMLPAVAWAHDETAPVAVHDGLAFHSDHAAELPAELVTRPVAQAALLDPAPVGVADAGELPETWCGSERTTDDAGGAAPTLPAVKLIYAHASDEPSRFAAVADRLQANVSLLSRFVAGQSGGRRTIRFDMGTSCGADYVDIQTIALPNPLSYYVAGGAPQFTRLVDDVRAAVGAAPGARDYAVYADRMRGTNGVSGTGQFYYGAAAETPDGTYHNHGGLVAAVWGRATLSSTAYADPTTMLHEITHNLGAVQGSAPHSTGYVGGMPAGHCFDEQDVMCYADGGPNNALTYTCPVRSGDVPETYDCGGDDYFNATPAPGSWLANHWNVYDSDFLGSCGELARTCGASGGGDAWPPANTTPVPPSGWVPRWTPTLAGTDTESPAGMTGQWRVDGGPVSSAPTASVTADGIHTLATRVADGAGNWSQWRTDNVRVDAGDPSVSVSCKPSAGGYACRARAYDERAGIQSLTWTRDGGAQRSTWGSFAVPAGGGEIRVTATDGAGRTAARATRLAPLRSARKPARARGQAEPTPRDGHKRTVAERAIAVRVHARATVARVSVPSLRVGAGRWRTRVCLDTCKSFVATAHDGRLAARTVSWRGKRRAKRVRVTVERRMNGAWVGVLAGQREVPR